MARLREGRANTARGVAHFLRETLGRVRLACAGGQLTVRADSGFYAHAVVAVCRRLGVRFSITIRQHPSVRRRIEAIPEDAWAPIPYWIDGGADVAETTYTPFAGEPDALPVRPTPGSQLALLTLYDYHAFITDRDGETLTLEADHRRHAEIENAIRDLKYGVALNHLPSGRFAANGAWLAVQVMAHNLARWTARIGLGAGIVTTKTLRRRLFGLGGRLTRSARRSRSTSQRAGHGPSAGAPHSRASARSRCWPDRSLTARLPPRGWRQPATQPVTGRPARVARPDWPQPGPHPPWSGPDHDLNRGRSCLCGRHRAAR